MFENPRRGRQARNFTTNVPKILVLKSSSEQIFSRKLPLGAPDGCVLVSPAISVPKDKYNMQEKQRCMLFVIFLTFPLLVHFSLL